MEIHNSRSVGVSPTLQKTRLWGLDLSNTLQGAGGVGGLLSETINNQPSTLNFFPTYDGNGNVSEYIATNTSVDAHFEYDAFGNVIESTGLAPYFPFRFSTKQQDDETGLLYYGYRYYDPTTGRWPSRDPIEERGGVNLYSFVFNNSLLFYDYIGQDPHEHHPTPHRPNASHPELDFNNHDLIREAGIDLKNDQTLQSLEGHGGRETNDYKRELKRRFDEAHRRFLSMPEAERTQAKAHRLFEEVNRGIMDDIAGGRLSPNRNMVTEVARRPPLPRGRIQVTRGGAVNALTVTIEVIQIIPGTIFEIKYIESCVKKGQSFTEAVRSLIRHYEYEEFKQKGGVSG